MVNCQETLLSSSLGKDSGFESAEDGELLPLTSDQLLKIRQQVEFYLSDEVVTKDQFLLKHVTKSKDGWLSLKLMSSFRKVKSLCKGYDWHVVANALKGSELLEVNDDSLKVRRKIAIPVEDETRPARTVVAFAGSRVPTLDSVTLAFADCGTLVSVKLLQPGEQVDDATKKVFGRHPKARQLTCAVIEFEKSESAGKAQKVAADYEVVLMKNCLKAHGKVEKTVNRERRTFSDSELQERKSSEASPTFLSWRYRPGPAEVKPRARSLTSERAKKESERKTTQQPKETEETRPRRFTTSQTSPLKNHVCAIRQPRGPDGSRGFLVRAWA